MPIRIWSVAVPFCRSKTFLFALLSDSGMFLWSLFGNGISSIPRSKSYCPKVMAERQQQACGWHHTWSPGNTCWQSGGSKSPALPNHMIPTASPPHTQKEEVQSTETSLQALHSSRGLLPGSTENPKPRPSLPGDFHSLPLPPHTQESELLGGI
jgi:hypothetical protein